MIGGISQVSIEGIEYHLPTITETSQDLLKDNPDWNTDDIFLKTGVNTRHISEVNETAADHACKAAKKLLADTDVNLIDCIIFVTQSPDYLFPTSACIIQNTLGLRQNCLAFDVNQGCSGYIYGLALGVSLLESDIASRVLLLCGETYTKYIDKHDRTCRPIFSDAGSATILAKNKGPSIGPFYFGTDGSGADKLILKNSGARVSEREKRVRIHMSGSEVFMFTMREIPALVGTLTKSAGVKLEDFSMFFFHQASRIVLETISRKLGLPEEKVYSNIGRIGNTVSSSIPIALADANGEGRINSGDMLLLAGFGVGLSWGGCVLRWKGLK